MKQNINYFINDNIHKLYHEMLKCINQFILSKSKFIHDTIYKQGVEDLILCKITFLYMTVDVIEDILCLKTLEVVKNEMVII